MRMYQSPQPAKRAKLLSPQRKAVGNVWDEGAKPRRGGISC